MEIAGWNIEWFGSAGMGPSDEALQLQNAKNVISQSGIDIWALGEISDAMAWQNLLGALPEYAGAISGWSQVQKTALLYRKSICTKIYQRHVLAGHESDFAGGRLPLEVALQTRMSGFTDTLYIFVVHLKANVGNATEKAESWDARKASSEAMKNFLDSYYSEKKFMVLGDWNDDVDVSILSPKPTPFTALMNDTADYFFVSERLSQLGMKSTVGFSDMVDHQCIATQLKSWYIENSSGVMYLDAAIPNFANSTSDHYPVYARYDPVKFHTAGVPLLANATKTLWYNGKHIVMAAGVGELRVFDTRGVELNVHSGALAPGLYYCLYRYNGRWQRAKIFVGEN